MTTPTYTLDHVRAALGDDAAAKLRDYAAPPPVSPELRLARECAAAIFRSFDRGSFYVLPDAEVMAENAALLALQRRHELDTPAEPQVDTLPDKCPYGEVGTRGSPEAYLIDPGAGSGSDRVSRFWPTPDVLADIIHRGGDITPLYRRTAYKPEPGK